MAQCISIFEDNTSQQQPTEIECGKSKHRKMFTVNYRYKQHFKYKVLLYKNEWISATFLFVMNFSSCINSTVTIKECYERHSGRKI